MIVFPRPLNVAFAADIYMDHRKQFKEPQNDCVEMVLAQWFPPLTQSLLSWCVVSAWNFFELAICCSFNLPTKLMNISKRWVAASQEMP